MTAEAVISISDEPTARSVEQCSVESFLLERLSADLDLQKLMRWNVSVNECTSEVESTKEDACLVTENTIDVISTLDDGSVAVMHGESVNEENVVNEAKEETQNEFKNNNVTEKIQETECQDESNVTCLIEHSEIENIESNLPESRVDDLLTQAVRTEEKQLESNSKHDLCSDTNDTNNKNMRSHTISVADEMNNSMDICAITPTPTPTSHLQMLLTQDVYSYLILIKLLSPIRSMCKDDNNNTCIYGCGVDDSDNSINNDIHDSCAKNKELAIAKCNDKFDMFDVKENKIYIQWNRAIQVLQSAYNDKMIEILHIEDQQKIKEMHMSVFCDHLQNVQAQLYNASPFSIEYYKPLSTLLPPQLPSVEGRHTLLLDLDETLVHSWYTPPDKYDVKLTIELDNATLVDIYVAYRPFLREFLDFVAPLFEVVIFTASMQKYCEPLMNQLDPHHTLGDLRLVREHCSVMNGSYIKDLSLLGRDLSKVAIIENSPIAYYFQPRNAIPVTSWFDDPNDNELQRLIPLLSTLSASSNVYDVLDCYNAFHRMKNA